MYWLPEGRARGRGNRGGGVGGTPCQVSEELKDVLYNMVNRASTLITINGKQTFSIV